MKFIVLTLFVCCLSLFISCKKDEPKPEKPYEFTGAGIFTCKINGVEYDIEGNCGRDLTTYETTDYVYLSATNNCVGIDIEVTLIQTEGGTLTTGVYDITSNIEVFPRGGGYYRTHPVGSCYFTGSNEPDILDGELNIQFLGRKTIDGRERRIVGGTFWFTTQKDNIYTPEDDKCELITVTEGFFDLQYIGAN